MKKCLKIYITVTIDVNDGEIMSKTYINTTSFGTKDELQAQCHSNVK